jgi:hypothetical protein
MTPSIQISLRNIINAYLYTYSFLKVNIIYMFFVVRILLIVKDPQSRISDETFFHDARNAGLLLVIRIIYSKSLYLAPLHEKNIIFFLT